MAQIGNTLDPNVARDVTTRIAPADAALDPKSGSVGAGNLQPTGAAPPAPKLAYAATMAAVGDLIDDIMGKALATGQNLDVLLLEATAKMKETIDASNKDTIKNDQAAKRLAILEKKAKLDEATEKIKEAIASAKDSGIFDKIKSALMALSGVIMIAVGVAVAVAFPGVGALAGAFLITSGVITIGLAIDSIIQQETGKGASGNLAKALGAEDKQAGIVDMAVRTYLGLAACVCGCAGSFVCPGGAIMHVRLAADVANSLATIGTSVGDVVYQQYNHRSTQARAEAKEIDADGKEIEAMMQALDNFIDMAIARLKASGERFNEMLDAQMEALKDFADTISNAKLTA